jgi:hypothetical protein
MISGYPARAAIAPGEQLVLHVSTSAPRFRVRFLRWGGRAIAVHESGWLPGKFAPPAGAGDDWEWPAYAFSLPAGLPSAPYIAWLEEPGGAPFSLAAGSAACLFVLRGSGASPILYKLPLATWHAYNYSGGGCFYQDPPRSLSPPGARVSFHRPGGGIGGPVWCAPDHYDPASPRQTFAHWDAPFIGWLARNGYAPEFCTGPCLHADPALLDRYRLLLTAGHDEYWSEPERDAVESFVARGGNLAVFGANTCWWRVHIAGDGAAMTCHQGGPDGALDHWWPASGAARPEDSLSGLSYRHAGGWWDGLRVTGGYAVQQAAHWIFDGTGLSDGQRFGAATVPPLVGYECDGAPLAWFDHDSGEAALSPHAHLDGTPAGFELLAASLLGDNWQDRPARAGYRAGEGIHAAAMGIFSAGGTVFSAGTTDWAQVLASGQEPRVGIITRNVIERLQAG